LGYTVVLILRVDSCKVVIQIFVLVSILGRVTLCVRGSSLLGVNEVVQSLVQRLQSLVADGDGVLVNALCRFLRCTLCYFIRTLRKYLALILLLFGHAENASFLGIIC